MKHIFLFSTMCFLLSSCGGNCKDTPTVQYENKSFVDYVNPLMGTDSNIALSTGNTYPAIAMPWGMNFWTPQTGRNGDGWAYTYNSTHIRGFKQTHQPSPWINDYGQFSIMPVKGMKIDQRQRGSWFSHKAEIAKPNYYSVYLADHDITTEITPTERAAMFRITFPESDSSGVVIDAFDRGSSIKIIPEERKVMGYTTRNSGGVPENFKNYFIIEFDKDFDYSTIWSDGKPKAGKELTDNYVGAYILFKTKRGEQVHARVASSFISYEQAALNMKELGNKSFDQLKQAGADRWNDVLGRIEVTGSDAKKQTFYSCLYRSVLFPRMFYEFNEKGEVVHYSPHTGEVLPGYMFTDTGFWDTFRCLFPFVNLVYPSMGEKMQAGLLNTYKESGFLPEWASPGHRGCMVGNNSASVVSDAILKNITDKSIMEELYEAMLKTANSVHPRIGSTGRLGYEYYNKLGYVPYNVGINESAARTLEYAYDDWCIAQVGKMLNRPQEEIDLYIARSQNYKNLFDPEHKLMRGKNEDGTFQSPYNPLKWGDAFTEGNAWHYTWSVFHDVQGLIDLMGGKKEFVQMMDSVFSVPPIFDDSYYGGVIHEIREMQIMNMGNYAHGNQPIQHMIYLYNYAGEPWKAQYWLRETMDKLYTATPDGYCGDEDNGQTSAWYVFSSMGFYPVCPGADQYVMGSPQFPHIVLHLENGKNVIIDAPENNKATRYVQNVQLNGQDYTKNYINYQDLLNGATFTFKMAEKPNTSRGTGENDAPYSYSLHDKK